VEQVLTEEQFRRIARGASTRADVERLIGPPWRVMDFPNKRQVAWDYVFQDSWGYTVDFSVMFDERGLVAELASVRRDFGDGGMH
jgi:outer membrane protein assembly factor BamE (lipoprotein component of BamABCDE complex)